MDDFSITQFGKTLNQSEYTIDLKNKTFATEEDDLVLDFNGCFGWTFKTGSHCTFKTDSASTFTTGDYCIFNTYGANCTFKTGLRCTFTTGNDCTFNTGDHCTFDTKWDCTFTTGVCCTFSVYFISRQTFKSGSSGVIIDRNDHKHYLLNEEFIQLQKVING